MPDQAELDRLMAQATGGAPVVPPDPNLIAMAQDAVTANQPLPGGVPAGVAAPAAPDPVDAALAAAQAPSAVPGAPGEAPPLARQIPDGSAQVAPGTSLGAEGPVMTPQDAGAPPAAKWDQPGVPPAGPPAPGAQVPMPGTDVPPVTSHGVSFPEAARQFSRAERTADAAAGSQEDLGRASAAVIDDKREAHLQQAEEIRRQTEERQVLEKAKNEGVASAQKLADEAEKKLSNFSYHDYFGTHKDENGNEVANPGGNKTLARVFSFISGFNVGAYGAPDIAYRNITKGIEMDMQRQKADLALAQDRSNRTREGVKDRAALFDSQLAMLDLKHAALLKATAEEGEAFAMQKGGAEEMARAKALGDKARADAAEKYAQGIAGLAKSQAELALTRARLAQSGPDPASVQTAVANYIAAHKNDQAGAIAFAGHIGSRDPSKLVESLQKQGATEDREGLQEQRAVRQDVAQWDQQNDFAKKAKAHDELNKLGEKLKGKPDPITVASALMELDVAARGGTATGASMSMFQSHLGGVMDQIRGAVEKGETGNLSDSQLEIVREALATAQRAAKTEGAELKKSYDDTFGDDPGAKKKAAGMFGRYGIKDGAEKAAPAEAKPGGSAPVASAAPAGGARVRLKDGRVGTLFPGGKFQPDEADIKL